jgi:hypothetical protein
VCTGIALAESELPTAVAADPRLTGRTFLRNKRPEVRFLWWQTPTILPVLWEGGFHLVPWGNKTHRGPLPAGGWIPRERIEDGDLAGMGAEEVVVPANFGHHKGTWFLISEGIRAALWRDRDGRPVVYLLTEEATNYYRNMTEQEPMMPVFVNQTI